MSDQTKIVENAIQEGYRLGANHVIEHIETRLFYCPDAWKSGPNSIIFNLVQNALADCKKIYGGVDDAKE